MKGGESTMTGKPKVVKFPRVYVSIATHLKIQKIALMKKVNMKYLGNKIVLAGIKAMGL